MSAQPSPIEQLGLYAAEQELIASDPYEQGHVREDAARKALQYRDEQLRMMQLGIGICATEGCGQETDHTHCEDFRSEMNGEPVDMPAWFIGVLVGFALVGAELLAVVGQGIDWSHARHLF